MASALQQHSLAIFAILSISAFLLQGVWLRRVKHANPPWLVWLLAATLLGSTWQLMDRTEARERERVRKSMEVFATMYASESELREHWKIPAGPEAAEDPRYLELIAAQKRWLKTNPLINDIYTLRKLPDGSNAFVVDSETDYDRNGKFEGEREERTPPGEIYKEEDLALERALKGVPTFEFDPITDRWGTWVSAFEPLHDPQGRAEAVLGVDFDAQQFLAAITSARMRILYLMGLVQTVLLGSSTLTSALQAEDRARRRTLAALHASEEHFRQVVHALPTPLATCDAEGRLTLFNRAAVELWGREPVLGTDKWTGAEKVLRPDGTEVPTEELPIARVLRSGEASRGRELVGVRPDGSRAYVLSYAEPMRDAEGKLIGVVHIIVDITERRAAEVRLAEVNKKLRDVSRQAGMAEVATSVLHNVGNVLNSANISLEVATTKARGLRVEALTKLGALLRDHAADLGAFVAQDPRAAQMPVFVTQLAEHFSREKTILDEELSALAKHIEHINEIIAMQQGCASSRSVLENTSLREVVEDALQLNAASLDRHGAAVKLVFDPAVPTFPIDRHKVIQILVNLIQNAKQAVDERSLPGEKRLTVQTEYPSDARDRVRITVSDNGVGIPAENMGRIFEHGFTTRARGHGFGLHASALAAHEMGGSLTAHSPGPLLGAQFTLEIPLKPSRA